MWSLAQLPRGCRISILGDVPKLLKSDPGEPPQALLLEQGWRISSPGFPPTSATQNQPLGDFVVIRNSLTPHPSLMGLHMQPPGVTLRHQGVSKNKKKKMKNMKRYKGTGKMIENSFCKVM